MPLYSWEFASRARHGGGPGASAPVASPLVDDQYSWPPPRDGIALRTVIAHAVVAAAFLGVFGDTVDLPVSGSSAITPSLVLSRTSGVAPFWVHVNASGSTSSDGTITSLANGGAFRNITHSFVVIDNATGLAVDLGNHVQSGLPRNAQAGGPIAAFLIETPGSFTIRDTMSHAGTLDKVQDSSTITVWDADVDNSASGGPNYTGANTIVVNNAGTNDGGGPSGATYTASASLTSIADGKRVRFKAGQTHDLPSGSWNNCLVESYGAGAKPVVSVSGLQNGGTTGKNSIKDLTLGGRAQFYRGQHNLTLRCTVNRQNSGNTAAFQTNEDGFSVQSYTAIWGCDSTDTTQVGTGSFYYGCGNRLVIVDCYSGKHVSHDIRVYNHTDCFIGHNRLTGIYPGGGTHCLKLHADSSGPSARATPLQWDGSSAGNGWISERMVVANNILGDTTSENDWTVALDPQNGSGTQQEAIRDYICENNRFYRGTSGAPTDIVMGGSRLTSRGNVLIAGGTLLVSTSVNSGAIPSGFDGPYFAN